MPIMVGASPVSALFLGGSAVHDVSLAGGTSGGIESQTYTGYGNRFAYGATLYQTNLDISNTRQATISMWAKAEQDIALLFEISKQGRTPTFSEDSGLRGVAHVLGPSALAFEDRQDPDANQFSFRAGADLTEMPTDEWHHVFYAIDTNAGPGAKSGRIVLDGVELGPDHTDVAAAFDILINGMDFGLPVGTRYAEGGSSYVNETYGPISLSDVQIWIGQFIDPDGASISGYTASSNATAIIRDCVNYMNTREVNPVEALAAMKIETTYGTFGSATGINGRQNLFQFLQRTNPGPYPANQDPYYLILGYTGDRTDSEDQYRAFANAWTSLQPENGSGLPGFTGAAVAAPNNYGTIVTSITGQAALPYQKFIIHNLGGSVSTVGAAGSINGYRLLAAWFDDDSLPLSEVGGLGLMLGQSKIYGDSPEAPEGAPVDGDTTVAEAIGLMQTVWAAAEASAQTYLDDVTLANLGFFIDADGKPVPPSAANDAFGPPTFLFQGPPGEFAVNQGTGGTVTQIGTITPVSGPGA